MNERPRVMVPPEDVYDLLKPPQHTATTLYSVGDDIRVAGWVIEYGEVLRGGVVVYKTIVPAETAGLY